MHDKLHSYIEVFNRYDEDLYAQLVSNAAAEQFLREQIPLIDCPDKDLEEIYEAFHDRGLEIREREL